MPRNTGRCHPRVFMGGLEGLFQKQALAQLGRTRPCFCFVFWGFVLFFVIFPGNRSSNRWTQIGRTGALAIARLTILGRRGGPTRSQPAEMKAMWGIHGSHGFFSFLAEFPLVHSHSHPLADFSVSVWTRANAM